MSDETAQAYENIAYDLQKIGYPATTAQMIREIHHALLDGDPLPHGVMVSAFARKRLANLELPTGDNDIAEALASGYDGPLPLMGSPAQDDENAIVAASEPIATPPVNPPPNLVVDVVPGFPLQMLSPEPPVTIPDASEIDDDLHIPGVTPQSQRKYTYREQTIKAILANRGDCTCDIRPDMTDHELKFDVRSCTPRWQCAVLDRVRRTVCA